MIKKIFFLVLFIPLFLHPQHIYGMTEEETLRIDISSETIMYGLPFEVEVSLTHVESLVGYQIKILYRSDLITYLSFDSTKSLSGTVFNHEEGVIYINYLNITTPLQNDTLILSLSFESLYEFDQSIKLFSLDDAYNEFVSFSEGQLDVLTYENHIPQSNPKSYGDVTFDDELSIDDVAMLQLFLAEKVSLNPSSKYVSDVNVDGIISVMDVAYMQLYLAGLIDYLGPQKTTVNVSVLDELIEVNQYIGRPLHLKPYEVEGYTFSHFTMHDASLGDLLIVTKEVDLISAVMLPNIVEVSFMSSHIQTNAMLTLPVMMKARNTLGEVVDIEVDWDQESFQTHQTGVFEINGTHPLYDSPITYTVHVSETTDNLNIISGYVYGSQNEEATVILSNNTNVWLTKTDERGYFEFTELVDGTYVVRVDLEGFKSGSPIAVTFASQQSSPVSLLSVRRLSLQPKRIEHVSFFLEEISEDGYYYEWFFTGDVFGYEQSVKPIKPKEVIFSDETYIQSNAEASITLGYTYKQFLINDGFPWRSEFASRLLEMFERIPMSWSSEARKDTIWMLTEDYLQDDIQISYGEDTNTVIISIHAFSNATPRLAQVDGVQGIYYSNRLYHAVTKFVTSEGYNLDAVDHILKTRFGVTVRNIDYANKTVFNEGPESFEQFKPFELLQILEMFEEMPSGFHKINELTFLVRRKDGSLNPMYPDAPAIAWVSHGYIEFMEMAFTTVSLDYLHRLILHEKAHFMWEFLFSPALKQAWIDLGGWYETDQTASGWATTQTTQFVSAYAHLKNPNEDMAESISYYLMNPDKLKSRAFDKYEFIEKNIMKSFKYISVIREDLTFEVLNLFPDYDYPGKIIRTKVTVQGLPEEDKHIMVEIELNNNENLFDGADYAITRIYSVEEPGKFFDLYLYPVNEEKSILRGTTTLSKYMKSGYWTTDQITVSDTASNQRFEGQGSIGFKMYINNALEDLTPPEFIEDSFRVDVVEYYSEGIQLFNVTVSFKIIEENISPYNTAHIYINAVVGDSYSYQNYGYYNFEEERVYFHFLFTQYFPNGYYDFGTLRIFDLGGNMTMIQLHLIEGFNEKHKFFLDTLSPDSKAPELDLNKISISATPTNPESPNGETLVTIEFYIRDDLSGVGIIYYILRNPFGDVFGTYLYHENTHSIYYKGDQTVWTKYTAKVTLPVGSMPGIWGLLEVHLQDLANNRITYNFSELITFETFD